MLSFRETVKLYELSPEEVVSKMGESSRDAFSPEGTPVLICAWNEEQDLPVTLAALSRSTTPVQPYVVDNASTDRTAEFADAMGAVVLEEPQPAKIHALRTGLDHIVTAERKKRLLLTDADTVMGRKWGEHLLATMQCAGDFSVVSGTALFHRYHGEDITRTAAITMSGLTPARYALQRLLRVPVEGRGHNMGLSFDTQARVQQILMGLSPDKIALPKDDTSLADLMRQEGARDGYIFTPSSVVITKGDRNPNLRVIIDALKGYHEKRTNYPEWYARLTEHDTEPQPSQKAA